MAEVFSCKFCEISKNTFFTEHLCTTASHDNTDLWNHLWNQMKEMDLKCLGNVWPMPQRIVKLN